MSNSPIIAQVTISIHADGTFNVSGPPDEIQCYGMIEKAKMQVWGVFMAKAQQQAKPGIVVAPPNLRIREPGQNGHTN